MISEKNEKHFDEGQYEILIECSNNGDLTEWNEWRENNQEISILLDGANLSGAFLCKANLAGANLRNANLAGADLWNADLKNTDLWNANLKGTELIRANLAGANLRNANLAGADLWNADLKGAKFIAARVDKQTFIWGCDIDKQTVITGIDLHLAKIEPRLIESLKLNLA